MTIPFVKNRKIAYIFSAALITLSLASLIFFGFKAGMDFVGGSLLELKITNVQVTNEQIQEVLKSFDINDAIITGIGSDGLSVRMKEVSEEQHQLLIQELKDKFSGLEETRFESMGPAIGKELKNKSITGIIFVILGISLYLTYAFRKVSRPMASWKYGLVTVIALMHDVIIPAGVFSALGHFLGWEIDANFIVALLVVLGFSVHDTIVVMDRIREKLRLQPGLDFGSTVNQSINETMTRSINTSLTLILVLLSLFIFGPVSLKNFVLVLLIGTFFGTYSSIFVASPLLYDWCLWDKRRQIKK
ncbi:MAG TPA: protein translocase subunit SecF [Candidatus Paceibacterota bacterium]|nr:protein translocase subunit SecF [Candidatus Paceibacterota bacterium]